jgi:hypothetical protein
MSARKNKRKCTAFVRHLEKLTGEVFLMPKAPNTRDQTEPFTNLSSHVLPIQKQTAAKSAQS